MTPTQKAIDQPNVNSKYTIETHCNVHTHEDSFIVNR